MFWFMLLAMLKKFFCLFVFFFSKNCSFQNSEKKCHFLTQDFASSCFVQGGAGTTFRPAITEPRPPRPGLELGFAEGADGCGSHFPARCANCCREETLRTTVMEWLPVLWGPHINLHSLSNHWPRPCQALIKALEAFLGCTVGCPLMLPAAKPQPLSCQHPTPTARWSQEEFSMQGSCKVKANVDFNPPWLQFLEQMSPAAT